MVVKALLHVAIADVDVVVVVVVAQQTNPLGVARPSPPIRPTQYYSIVIANLPTGGEEGISLASPNQPWLEMYTAIEPKKRRGCASYHTSWIELEADRDRRFDVLLDDQLYGPFNKIRYLSLSVCLSLIA
jgi:hypothetical protein